MSAVTAPGMKVLYVAGIASGLKPNDRLLLDVGKQDLDPRRVASITPDGPVDVPAPHPHRAPLSAPVRPGRAGTVPARTHRCVTPHRAHPRHRSAHPSAR